MVFVHFLLVFYANSALFLGRRGKDQNAVHSVCIYAVEVPHWLVSGNESAKIGAVRLGCQAIILKKQECRGLLSLQTVLAIVSGVSILHHAVLTN